MKEEDIRKYVRLEVLREEATFLGTLLSSFTDVLKVAKIAFKDILNSTRHFIAISFTSNPEKIKQLKERYKTTKEGIISDYQNKIGEITSSMGSDFQFVAYVMAPGQYLAAKAIIEGPGWINDMKDFLRESGFDFDYAERRGEEPETEEEKRDASIANMTQQLLRGAPMQLKAFQDAQRQFINDLDRRLGITGLPEGLQGQELLPVIVEAASEKRSIPTEKEFKLATRFMTKAFIEAVSKMPPETLVKPEDMKKLIDFKSNMSKDFVEQLNSPFVFAANAAKAKDISELRNLIKLQSSVAIKISGLGKETDEKIRELSQNLVEKAKKDGKEKELLKSGGIAGSANDESLFSAAVVIVTKKTIEDFVMTIRDPKAAGEEGKKFLQALESLRTELLEQYSADVTDDVRKVLSKTKEGKAFLKVHDEGLQKIKMAGLPVRSSGE